jgi:hypothetical protein
MRDGRDVSFADTSLRETRRTLLYHSFHRSCRPPILGLLARIRPIRKLPRRLKPIGTMVYPPAVHPSFPAATLKLKASAVSVLRCRLSMGSLRVTATMIGSDRARQSILLEPAQSTARDRKDHSAAAVRECKASESFLGLSKKLERMQPERFAVGLCLSLGRGNRVSPNTELVRGGY